MTLELQKDNTFVKNMMREGKKLKKCPFCGGEASIIGHSTIWVYCNECLGQTAAGDTEEEAIEAWNRRVGETE
ncbi:Lar family restriction alleviation protein [Anaerovoracaceae bacterium 42-11]